jgi:tetratricopeptide (TPR) repeat protein
VITEPALVFQNRLLSFQLLLVLVLLLAFSDRPARSQEADGTAQALVERGDRLLEEDDPREASKQFRKALDRNKSYVPALIGLARAALAREEWQEASDWSGEALELDENSFDAHYYYAISHRERAKYRTITQFIHWTKSKNHFEWIVERDSTYRSVLYHYALMERYRENFEKAFDLMEAQIRLRPELDEAQYGVFKVYQHYLHRTSLRKALERLSASTSPYAKYFRGEALRRLGRLEEADAVFTELLDSPIPFPPQPVLLSRARVQYVGHDSLSGQLFVEEAIERISNKLEADLVLDDFKYLMSDQELERYRSLSSPEEYRGFFKAFWSQRDPMPASRVNLRLQEHYRRLAVAEKDHGFFGFRTWHNSPDKLGELDFTEAYELNREFNDRGFMYVRHGEPNERVTAVAASLNQNESWRYYGNPPFDLHFERVPDGLATNSWRLTPLPPLDGRIEWGGSYALPVRSELDAVVKYREIAEASRKHVMTGLTSERFVWPEQIEPVEIPHLAATFREPDGTTRLEIHYALPPEILSGDPDEPLTVEVGYAVHDLDWGEVNSEVNERRIDRPAGENDYFTVHVAPDSYHVAIHQQVVDRPGPIGVARFDHRVPDMTQAGLNASELLPARLIRPATAPDRFNRGELYVQPEPGAVYTVGEPIFVYFEVYDLAMDDSGRTSYALEYTLRPERGRKRLFGLLGRGDRAAVTLRAEQSGDDTSPVEYAALDAAAAAPGLYTLTVRVEDLLSGAKIERSRVIELKK